MEKVVNISPDHLEPFSHQVAGQSLVFQYDADTICKSLTPRELQVYQTLPYALKPHVPQYRGVVDIALDSPNGEEANENSGQEGGAKHPLTTQRLLGKLAKRHAHDNVYHFLLLENIVAKFQMPCVLDLKLGTRQHGDDAPSDKVRYQVSKCHNTTSALLGVRLCGMKVYHPATKDYVTVDKAEGRRMREKDLREAMRHFLYNGRHLRRDLIPPLLQRLRRLKATIADLPSFRFYSSSLLIVYDGMEVNAADTHDAAPCACSAECRTGEESGFSSSPGHGFSSISSEGSTVKKMKMDRSEMCLEQSSDADKKLSDIVNCHDETSVHDSLGVSSCNMNHLDSQLQTVYSSLLSEQSQENLTEVIKGNADIASEAPRVIHSETAKDALSSPRCFLNQSTRTQQCFQEEQSQTTDLKGQCASPKGPAEAHEKGFGNINFLTYPASCECNMDKVDVRMVDFAHTTHAGFQDRVVHKGVDRGCIQGLQTLIDMFTHIYTQTTHQIA